VKITVKGIPLRALRYADSALKGVRFRNLVAQHRLGGFSSAPFPVLGKSRHGSASGKGRNSFTKLQVLLDNMPKNAQTIVDIGSNNGFFAIHLAQQGYDVLGYEPVRSFVQGSNQVCEEFGIPNAVFIERGMDLENSKRLFDADVTLVLSVWHNWVKQADFPTAIEILKNIWARTRVAMFFELASTLDNRYIAGFDTMPNMGSTVDECGEFIAREIVGKLPNADVELLGLVPTDYINGSARHMFIARRRG
jgi:SAM-dependent methyltransferase